MQLSLIGISNAVLLDGVIIGECHHYDTDYLSVAKVLVVANRATNFRRGPMNLDPREKPA